MSEITQADPLAEARRQEAYRYGMAISAWFQVPMNYAAAGINVARLAELNWTPDQPSPLRFP